MMSLLGIPLKDLLLKEGAEEFVGTVEPLKSQALKFAILKVWSREVFRHLTPIDVSGNSVPRYLSGAGA